MHNTAVSKSNPKSPDGYIRSKTTQNDPSITLSVVGFYIGFPRKITSSKMRQRVRHTEILKLINFASKGIKKLKTPNLQKYYFGDFEI